MQVDKKGNIVNEPQFKVNGDERRELKKKLSLLKSYVKTFWHWETLSRDIGAGMDDWKCNVKLTDAKQEIEELELKLSEKFDLNLELQK